MPNLHLGGQRLIVESFVDLQLLKGEEVEVGQEALSLHLLLVEFSQVCHSWEAREAALRGLI